MWKAKKYPDVWQGQHRALEVQQALIFPCCLQSSRHSRGGSFLVLSRQKPTGSTVRRGAFGPTALAVCPRHTARDAPTVLQAPIFPCCLQKSRHGRGGIFLTFFALTQTRWGRPAPSGARSCGGVAGPEGCPPPGNRPPCPPAG